MKPGLLPFGYGRLGEGAQATASSQDEGGSGCDGHNHEIAPLSVGIG